MHSVTHKPGKSAPNNISTPEDSTPSLPQHGEAGEAVGNNVVHFSLPQHGEEAREVTGKMQQALFAAATVSNRVLGYCVCSSAAPSYATAVRIGRRKVSWVW